MADPVTWLVVGSTALSAVGSIKQGKEERKAAEFEAGQIEEKAVDVEEAAAFDVAQLEEQATAQYAKGTREAYESTRQGEIVESKARAAMAAGGGVVDPEVIAKVAAETEYETLAAMYEGETQQQATKRKAQASRYTGMKEAKSLRKQAAEVRRGGKVRERASQWKALSTVVSGGTKAYKGYKTRTG